MPFDPQQIGQESGIGVIDEYNRKGLILDCHLTGLLSWRQAVELATFYEAEEVLERLDQVYRPKSEGGFWE